jgi:hypothetical protein
MDKPKVFPPEFATLEEPLRKLQERTTWIDKRIKELEQDQPRNVPGGPGFNNTPTPDDAWREIKLLAKEKQDLSEKYHQDLDEVLSNADPKENKRVREISAHQLSQNEYRRESKEELKMRPVEEKHFDRSMNFMESLHYNTFRTPDVHAVTNPYSHMTKETLQTHQKESKPSSQSMDFMESLHNPIIPQIDLNRQQQDPVPDKGTEQTHVSPNEKLSQSLENPNNLENGPGKEDDNINVSTRTDVNEPEPGKE